MSDEGADGEIARLERLAQEGNVAAAMLLPTFQRIRDEVERGYDCDVLLGDAGFHGCEPEDDDEEGDG